MTDQQKARYRELNRKTAAAKRLELKQNEIVIKERNKVRQQKCRLLKQIPSSGKNYKILIKSAIKVAENSPKKMQILKDCVASFKSVDGEKQKKEGKVSVLHLQFLRKSNRVKEHAVLVKKLLKDYGSIRKASLQTGFPYKSLHKLCQPPVVRKKQTKQVWSDIRSFYTSSIISHELPSVKCKERRFLNLTLEECFSIYREGCIRIGEPNVSFSTFCKLRPKCVFKVDQTPDRQCICDQCENFRLAKNQLIKVGVLGIPAHVTDCIKRSMCEIDSFDSSSDRNDSFHQITSECGKIECITRNCSSCGTTKLHVSVLEANPGLEENKNIIQWTRWISVQKYPGSKIKKLILQTFSGTRKELLDIFLTDLVSMSQHIFSANWNYAMFQYVRDNLKPGYLLQVLDFGQNYMNIFQDEPQSVHWDHTQTTIHPIVNFYFKEGESVITIEEHIMITDDSSHDKFAVNTFEQASLDHLKKNGFIPTHIIQFNDNCSGQYKGRGTFQFVSYSDVPKLKMYFGARHGKGPADGAVGRVKAAATRAVKARQVLIWSAREFYDFCKQKLNRNTAGTFIQNFFYIENINRDVPIVAVTTKSSSTWHSVRSFGIPLVVEAREIGCVCESCVLGDGHACPNQAYCQPWKAINLRTGKPLLDENFKNLQWPLPLPSDRSDRFDRFVDCSNSLVDSSTDIFNESSEWDPVLHVLERFTTYSDLENYIESLPKKLLKPLKCAISKFKPLKHSIDNVAKMSLPHDSPCNYIPVFTVGDGNCFPRSLSCACFGDDSRHVLLRAKIVVEGVYNKQRYLDNSYLSMGLNSLQNESSFTEQYALFSGQYAHGNIDEIIECVYEKEMLEMSHKDTHMGMWQIWASTNVTGRPIMSIFPDRGSAAFRSDFKSVMCTIPCPTEEERTNLHYVDPYST